MEATFKYCLDQKLLGVGWRIPSNASTKDWDTYFEEASQEHAKLSTVKYMYKWVEAGSLIWTRDPKGRYYLARVVSGWEYFSTKEAIEKDIDIGNVVRVEFEEVALDEVPGKVVASFRPPRALQEIWDPTAREYSKFLWNHRAAQDIYELDPAVMSSPDVFSLLDAEEVEDIVFLYLQTKGWFVVPSSRKVDTLAFEYLVINPQTGDKAQVQVKTGGAGLNQDHYADLPFKVILFQSMEHYSGSPQAHVTCLRRDDVEHFIGTAKEWLPARYRLKIAMLDARR